MKRMRPQFRFIPADKRGLANATHDVHFKAGSSSGICSKAWAQDSKAIDQNLNVRNCCRYTNAIGVPKIRRQSLNLACGWEVE
jgi:hypothetical protein